MNLSSKMLTWLLPVCFLSSRFVIFLGLSPDHHFGDLGVYYQVAQLKGWPFIDHWVEYPPLFPFLNEILYRLGMQDWVLYLLLLMLLLGTAGAAALFFFQKTAVKLYGVEQGFLISVIFFALLATLPYSWWYFDLLPLAFLLAGAWWLTDGCLMPAGLAVGLGMLAKWFPGFVLAAALRYRPVKSSLRVAGIAAGLVALVMMALWLVSPQMTAASFASQPMRSSWQTVWAYLDGNRTSGWFVTGYDLRYDPVQAYVQRGNPPRISPHLTLAFSLLLGLFFFWRVKNFSDRSLLAFTGMTFVVFLLWSPGWSPQWVMYIVPLILLTLPLRQSLPLSFTLLVITLLEWPIFLGQYWFRGVFAIAGLRTILFALLVFLWYRITRTKEAI